MGYFFDNNNKNEHSFFKEDKKDDRSHQDNFGAIYKTYDNGNYQFCRSCNANRAFRYDRCVICGSN